MHIPNHPYDPTDPTGEWPSNPAAANALAAASGVFDYSPAAETRDLAFERMVALDQDPSKVYGSHFTSQFGPNWRFTPGMSQMKQTYQAPIRSAFQMENIRRHFSGESRLPYQQFLDDPSLSGNIWSRSYDP